MTKVTLLDDKSRPLAVMLRLDLETYCKACKILWDTREASTIAKLEIVEAHQQARTQLDLELSGIGGELHWLNIEKMLAEQCDRCDWSENQLFEFLDNKGDENPQPLVLECLKECFVELLKNSVDSMLENYLMQKSAKTMLEMSIKLKLEDNNIAVIITDNAGGFTPLYLENSMDYIQSKAYQQAQPSSKVGGSQYYFGGAGRGMSLLFNLLLEGDELKYPGRLRKRFDVVKGETFIHLQNSAGGAKISLVSPLAACTPHVVELSPADGHPALQLKLPPPKKRRLASPQEMYPNPARLKPGFFMPAHASSPSDKFREQINILLAQH